LGSGVPSKKVDLTYDSGSASSGESNSYPLAADRHVAGSLTSINGFFSALRAADYQPAAAVFPFRYLVLLRRKAAEQGLSNGGLCSRLIRDWLIIGSRSAGNAVGYHLLVHQQHRSCCRPNIDRSAPPAPPVAGGGRSRLHQLSVSTKHPWMCSRLPWAARQPSAREQLLLATAPSGPRKHDRDQSSVISLLVASS
jgi:hypothetical protein